MADHSRGKSFATAPRRPLELVYYEACRSQADALKREKYLKNTEGRRYLAKRMNEYLQKNNLKLY